MNFVHVEVVRSIKTVVEEKYNKYKLGAGQYLLAGFFNERGEIYELRARKRNWQIT